MRNLLSSVAMVVMMSGYVASNCQRLAVLTYNTALTITVPDYETRRQAVIRAIKEQGQQVDFMCLQEVWDEEDMASMLKELAADFPHHYSAIHYAVGQWEQISTWKSPACKVLKLVALSQCLPYYCQRAADYKTCALEKCSGFLYNLSSPCRTCLSMVSGFRYILNKCLDPYKKFTRVNSPGLLVLSKRPLTNAQYVNYHPDEELMVERGYIKAEIAENNITAICTHFTPVFSTYYPVAATQYKNYQEMQAAEITMLTGQFNHIQHILLGDLNMGPERKQAPNLTGEVEEHYNRLINSSNYRNPYMESNGQCTFCKSSNPVLKAAITTQAGDSLIDHVLLSSDLSHPSNQSKRVFDKEGTKLSDHYGVQLELCLP